MRIRYRATRIFRSTFCGTIRPCTHKPRRAFASDLTDGPFIESKVVLGGYWLVEANSKEELVKCALRCPTEAGDVIEIRQVFAESDFAIKK
jgi:hypothetical protein